jgi:hypothetical protein
MWSIFESVSYLCLYYYKLLKMFASKSLLQRMIVPAQARALATATGSINDRFEAAYQSRRADLNKVEKKR